MDLEIERIEAVVDVDDRKVSDETVGWQWWFAAVLVDGSRIGGGMPDHSASVPRRGLGAIYRTYDGPLQDFEEIDRTYHVREKDVRDCVQEAFDGYPHTVPHLPPEVQEEQANGSLYNLLAALRESGYVLTAGQIREVPLAIQLSDRLREELTDRG